MVKEEADVVIAKSDEGYEPLHAIYRRETCIPAIEAAIASDKWRMDSWFPQVKIRLLTSEEINRYDPGGLAFLNINTPEDFAQAEQHAQRTISTGQVAWLTTLLLVLPSTSPAIVVNPREPITMTVLPRVLATLMIASAAEPSINSV